MKKKICIFMCCAIVAMFLPGCSLDGLFEPDDAQQPVDHLPRDRYEPNEPSGKSLQLFMPLSTGNTWTYDVSYKQTSAQSEYTVEYVGEEKWTCTQTNFSDSTFVFQTTFRGDKTIVNNSATQTFSESSSATVTAKIHKGALTLDQEDGEKISPFFDDWLFSLDGRFRIGFSIENKTINQKSTTSTLTFDYTLDKTKGLVAGELVANSQYDQKMLIYKSN